MSPAEAEVASLPPVLVAANRVLEPLQDVPVAVTAVSGAALEGLWTGGFQQGGQTVPNVYLQRPAGDATAIQYNIRGISAGATSPQLDAGVALYLDGVYLGRPAPTVFDFSDLERIEVLRGPQGTLFGHNATGGALNMVSHAPSGVFGASADLSVGNDGFRSGRLVLDLPVMSGLAARVSVGSQTREGYARNSAVPRAVDFGPVFGTVSTSPRFGDENRDGARLALRYTGVRGLTLDFRGEYSRFKGTPMALQLLSLDPADASLIKFDQQAGLPGAGTQVVGFGPRRAVPAGLASPTTLHLQGQSFSADYAFAEHQSLKFIGGWRGYDKFAGGHGIDGNAFVDPQGSGDPSFLTYTLARSRQRQWSQELQWIGQAGAFNWIAGLFHFEESVDFDSPVMSASLGNATFAAVSPVDDQDYRLGQQTHARNESSAAYVHGRYALGDWTFNAGLRETRDRREEILDRAGSSPGSLDLKYRGLTSRYRGGKLDHDASIGHTLKPGMNAYVRLATGYVSGGVLLGVPFMPEELRTVELGLKSEFGALRINAALFEQKRTHAQMQIFDLQAGGYTLLNAGSNNASGLELESTWQPARELRLHAAYGLMRNRNQNGVRSFQPRQTLHLDGEYQFSRWPGGVLPSLRVGANWRDAAYRLECPIGSTRDPQLGCIHLETADWALDRQLTLKAHATLNARFSMANLPLGDASSAKLAFWVRNFNNSRPLSYVFTLGNKTALGTYEDPRTWGVELSVAY
ncbi:MAG TPA: TonB-dependent receptor [Burkholderiaceae bacterium]